MSKPRNYRRDFRTKEQFAEDIKNATITERKLMEAYVSWLNNTRGDEKYTFEDHGVDNTGEYIDDDRKVNTKADFILKRRGKPNRKIEIKFCREEKDCFHLKIDQMTDYVMNDTCIINFMGINGDNPRFCILTPDALVEWMRTGERVEFRPWGGKLCIKFPVDNEHITWHKVNLNV